MKVDTNAWPIVVNVAKGYRCQDARAVLEPCRTSGRSGTYRGRREKPPTLSTPRMSPSHQAPLPAGSGAEPGSKGNLRAFVK
jgi:hypothetical protein